MLSRILMSAAGVKSLMISHFSCTVSQPSVVEMYMKNAASGLPFKLLSNLNINEINAILYYYLIMTL